MALGYEQRLRAAAVVAVDAGGAAVHVGEDQVHLVKAGADVGHVEAVDADAGREGHERNIEGQGAVFFTRRSGLGDAGGDDYRKRGTSGAK